MPGDHRATGDRKLAGRQRDTDADAGRDVPPPEAILGFMDEVSRAADETHDAYLSLCWLLLAVLADGNDPGDVGRTAGRLIGNATRSDDSGAPDDVLVQLENFLQSRGFMPKQIGSRPEVGFELGRCPYEQAALANPGLVCGLHRALAEGMVEALGGVFEVTKLVARHPTTAGCRLELRTVDQPN
jgi:hypothetical protein